MRHKFRLLFILTNLSIITALRSRKQKKKSDKQNVTPEKEWTIQNHHQTRQQVTNCTATPRLLIHYPVNIYCHQLNSSRKPQR